MPKSEPAEVVHIDNLPFSIVVTQKQLSGNARSTVGTYTDIYTAVRLLFSRMAQPFIGYSMTYSFNNPGGRGDVSDLPGPGCCTQSGA